MIRRSKINLVIYIANKTKSNTKEFFTFVRNKKVITTNIGQLHLENGKVINTESELAEVLNDYLASVYTVGDTYEVQAMIPAQPTLIPLSDCDFTEDAVTKAFDNIEVNKTLGPDYIAPRVLKEAKYQICKLLAILFNKSLNVPDIWKLANVTPIQNKEINHYRLITDQSASLP